MKSILRSAYVAARGGLRGRAALLLEVAALRQQFEVYRRQTPRPRLTRSDRLFWIWLRRNWPGWRSALVIVKPSTVLRWHRDGYRRYWRRRSRGKVGRPRIPRKHIAFIKRISADHPEWGEDRITLELKLKLGVVHSPSTVRRYMVQCGRSPKSTWRQFITGHAEHVFALDFTTQPLWNYGACYVLVILALHNRRVVHVAVTPSPTLNWVKQQVREATAWDEVPRFLIHDTDGIFGQFRKHNRGSYRCALDAWLASTMGIRGIPIPYGAPNASAHIERFMGTLRRECLEHFVFLSGAHLERTVREFVRYYNDARPHQGIGGIPAIGIPAVRDPPVEADRLVAMPILGGLHHDYRLAA